MLTNGLTLVMIGGGTKCPPPIFICENNRKSNKIMHCVEKKKLSGSFEDRAIFHVIQLSYDGGGALCAHYRSIDKFVKNAHDRTTRCKH